MNYIEFHEDFVLFKDKQGRRIAVYDPAVDGAKDYVIDRLNLAKEGNQITKGGYFRCIRVLENINRRVSNNNQSLDSTAESIKPEIVIKRRDVA